MPKDLIDRLHQDGFSGQMVTVQNGQTLVNFANGLADRSAGRVIDDHTLFAIASGTKFLTALAIAKLIEQSEGKLSFETPAVQVLDLQISNYDHRMTLGQLLSHTSGIPDYLDEDLEDEHGEIALALPNCVLWNPSDYLPLFPKRQMDFEPGTQFKYNNGGYIYLALIIEKLSGMSYAQYINEGLLRPIGVRRAGVYAITALPQNTAHGYYRQTQEGKACNSACDAEGYIWNVFKTPPQAGGDGGIYMNPFDMRHIWEAFFRGEIVSQASVKQMTTPVSCVNRDRSIYYGLGLWLRGKDSKDDKAYEPYIMGSDVGVSFMSSYDPAQKLFKYAVSNTGYDIWNLGT